MEHLLPLTIDELKAIEIIIGSPDTNIYPHLGSLQKKVTSTLNFAKSQDLPTSFTEHVLSLSFEDLEDLELVVCGTFLLDLFPNATIRLPNKIRKALNFARHNESTLLVKGNCPGTEKYSPFIGGCESTECSWKELCARFDNNSVILDKGNK